MFEGFRADPASAPLPTPSGRLELFSDVVEGFDLEDCPGHAIWLAPQEWLGAPLAAIYPIHLLTDQPRHKLHSQLDGSPWSASGKVAGREPVFLNPADAEARGIGSGDVVEVFNARGRCLAGAIISAEVMPGVARISTVPGTTPSRAPGETSTATRTSLQPTSAHPACRRAARRSPAWSRSAGRSHRRRRSPPSNSPSSSEPGPSPHLQRGDIHDFSFAQNRAEPHARHGCRPGGHPDHEARAGGAEFTFKYANNAAGHPPADVRAREAADAILTETNGRVDIQIFPNNQLGSDTDMLSQLRSGALEFFTLSPLILSTLVPGAPVNGLGFMWSGYDKVWPAMDGELGAYVRAQIEKAGLYAFEKIWENGFRQTTSSTRPIVTPDDFKGFKIRVPPSPLWTSMFKAFDAAPMSINFSEVYSALQTKIAEGQENPLVLIDTAKLYEVQKYLSKTNHMWDGFWLLANGKTWNGLPKDVQAVIEKHFNAAAVLQREDIAKRERDRREDAERQGHAGLNRRHGRLPGEAAVAGSTRNGGASSARTPGS